MLDSIDQNDSGLLSSSLEGSIHHLEVKNALDVTLQSDFTNKTPN